MGEEVDFAKSAGLANTAIMTQLLAVLRERGVLTDGEISGILADARATLHRPQATKWQSMAAGVIDQMKEMLK